MSEQKVNQRWRAMLIDACKDTKTRKSMLEKMLEFAEEELQTCSPEDEAAFRGEIESYHKQLESL